MSVHLKDKEAEPDRKLAEHTVLLDNDKTTITYWCFAPGTQTGWHNHIFDYATIQQSGGRLLLQSENGATKTVDYEVGRTVAYKAPIVHNAINICEEEVRVIEIEYKV